MGSSLSSPSSHAARRRMAARLLAVVAAAIVAATVLVPTDARALVIPDPVTPSSVIYADTGDFPAQIRTGQHLELVPGTWTEPIATRHVRWWDCATAPAMTPTAVPAACEQFASGTTAVVPASAGHTLVVTESVSADLVIEVWTAVYKRQILAPELPVTPAGITAVPAYRGIALRIPSGGDRILRITVDGTARVVDLLGGGTYVWTGLTRGTQHAWTVEARATSHGAEWFGPVASGTTVGGMLPPYAPTRLKVTWRKGGVMVLTWTQRTDALHPVMGWGVGLSPTTFRKRVYTPRWTFTQKVVGKPFRVYVKASHEMGGSPVASILTKRPR